MQKSKIPQKFPRQAGDGRPQAVAEPWLTGYRLLTTDYFYSSAWVPPGTEEHLLLEFPEGRYPSAEFRLGAGEVHQSAQRDHERLVPGWGGPACGAEGIVDAAMARQFQYGRTLDAGRWGQAARLAPVDAEVQRLLMDSDTRLGLGTVTCLTDYRLLTTDYCFSV